MGIKETKRQETKKNRMPVVSCLLSLCLFIICPWCQILLIVASFCVKKLLTRFQFALLTLLRLLTLLIWYF